MRRATTLLSIAVAAIPAFAADPPNVREYEERCVNYYARQYGVSAALVRAVIQVESAWQPGAVSSKGAMGLMQLMPATAQHFGVVHPFYIHENVRGGVAYLAELQRTFSWRPSPGHGRLCRRRAADSCAWIELLLRRSLRLRSTDCTTISRRIKALRREINMRRLKACVCAMGLLGIASGQNKKAPPAATPPVSIGPAGSVTSSNR